MVGPVVGSVVGPMGGPVGVDGVVRGGREDTQRVLAGRHPRRTRWARTSTEVARVRVREAMVAATARAAWAQAARAEWTQQAERGVQARPAWARGWAQRAGAARIRRRPRRHVRPARRHLIEARREADWDMMRSARQSLLKKRTTLHRKLKWLEGRFLMEYYS